MMENGNYEPGKMFVGGLSWETSKESLVNYFSKYGELVTDDCVIMKDPTTQRPRGFGFVKFQDPHSVENVLAETTHVLDKKTIDPKQATSKGVSVSTNTTVGKENSISKKVFVGGIPSQISPEEVEEVFKKYGKVLNVDLKMDKQTGRLRGFGFVTFEFEEDAAKAVHEHFILVDGKRVEIKNAEPRDQKSAAPHAQYYSAQTMASQYPSFGYPTSYTYHQTAQQSQYSGAASAQYAGYTSGYGHNAQQYAGYGATAPHQSYPYEYPATAQQHTYPQDTSSYGAANPTSYPGEYNSAAAAAAGYGYTPDQTNQYHHYDQATGVASAAGYPRAAQTQQRVTPAAGAYTNFGATR